MLTVYSINQAEQWDAIVCSFKDYDVYWLSGYVKAFMIHGDGSPLLFFYEDDNVRGINVVMKRDISNDSHFSGLEENKWFDFSTPYGYGGWIIEGTDAKKLFDTYENWCKNNNIISEFVRFHPICNNYRFSTSNYDVIALGNTISLDVSSSEIIWNNITSKNRNMIRKAQKNNIKIYHGQNIELYDEFRSIYNKTMDKDHAKNYYYFLPYFYQSICEDLHENAHVFYAKLDQKIIAMSIILMANGKVSYHLSGSLQEYSQYAPTNLLLYEVAVWASENGCKSFHLGGGVGSGEDSLFHFKKSFYRLDNLPQFYIGKKIFDLEKYNFLLEQRKDLQQSNFFPQYRA